MAGYHRTGFNCGLIMASLAKLTIAKVNPVPYITYTFICESSLFSATVGKKFFLPIHTALT